MALFNTPEKHAANPPATWQVVKVVERRWDLKADGGVIDSFTTKREAEEHKTTGRWVRLYEDEGRWYAGESVRGWRPYKPPVTASK
jgi:hypothetical protein